MKNPSVFLSIFAAMPGVLLVGAERLPLRKSAAKLKVMHGALVVGLIAATGVMAPRPGLAVPVLDQSNDNYASSARFLSAGIDWAQTFTVGLSGRLASVSIKVGRDLPLLSASCGGTWGPAVCPFTGGPITVDIRTTSGGAPTGPDSGANILGSGVLTQDQVFSWAPSFFSIDVFPIPVSAGDILAIAVSGGAADNGTGRYVLMGDMNSSSYFPPGYPGGTSFLRTIDHAGIQGAWNVSDAANGTTTLDLFFKTYVETVPEPTTLALFAFGLAGLEVMRRKRKLR